MRDGVISAELVEFSELARLSAHPKQEVVLFKCVLCRADAPAHLWWPGCSFLPEAMTTETTAITVVLRTPTLDFTGEEGDRTPKP